MRNKIRLATIALLLSVAMFMLAIPQVLLVKAGEAIKEIDLTTTIKKVENLPDVDATIDFESLTIVAEDTAKRTANSKEYILDNGMRMVKQFTTNVHYYEDGQFKEIGEKAPTLDGTISTTEQPLDTGFKVVNIYESGKVASDKQLVIGKKEGSEKSDAYLQFKMAEKGEGYNMLYSRLEFSHETQGIELGTSKSIKYSVSMVENAESFEQITFSNKPKQIGETKTYGSAVNLATTTAQNTYEIDVSAVQNNTVTLAIETEQENSAGVYSVMNPNQIVLITIYNRTYGLDENYGAEKIEVDGIQAYVDYDNNHLTLNAEVFTVNSMGSTPIALSLINNQGYEDIFDEIEQTNIGNVRMFGKNTKLNFQQYTRKITGLAKDIIVYYDADGSTNQFYHTGNGYYHSYMNTLTLKEVGTTHYIYDASGNVSKFVNGKLTEIYNNPGNDLNATGQSEIIKITYTGTTGKISKISYYTSNSNETADYEVVFTVFGGSFIHSIKAYKGTTALIEYYVFYNSNACVSSIYNAYESLDAYSFEYVNTEGNPIALVHNHKLGGISFEYDSSKTVQEVETIQGGSLADSSYIDRISFYDHGNYERVVTYYLTNSMTYATKHVELDEERRAICEWLEDRNGNVIVYDLGVWSDVNASEYVFDTENFASSFGVQQEKKKITHTLKQGTTSLTGAHTIVAGGSIQGSITEAPAIDSDTCAYALTFNVIGEDGATIQVAFYGGNSRTVTYANNPSIYVTVLCGYIEASSSPQFIITSNKEVTISNVSYGIVEYLEETRKFNSENNCIYTSNMLTKTTSGVQTSYNLETKTQEVRNAQGLVETTTQTVDEDGNQITELRRDGQLIYTTTTEVSEDSFIQTTRDANGTLLHYVPSYNGTYQNGDRWVTVSEYGEVKVYVYGISGGDERLIRYEDNSKIELYTYNYFGEIATRQIVEEIGDNYYVLLEQENVYFNGILTGVNYSKPNSTSDYSFNLSYDSKGRISQILHNGTAMLEYSYGEIGVNDIEKLLGKTYANGNVVNYTYDNEGITNVEYKNSVSSSPTDEYIITRANSQIASISHVKNSNTMLTYSYSGYDSDKPKVTIQGLSETFSYESTGESILGNNLQVGANITVGTSATPIHTLSQTYNKLGQLTQSGYSAFNSYYEYDTMGKITNVATKYNQINIENKTYQYDSDNRLYKVVNNLATNKYEQLLYDYDGNISQITQNGAVQSVFTYDSLNRITSDSAVSNRWTTTYTYNGTQNAVASRYSENTILGAPEPTTTNYSYNTLGQLSQMSKNGVNSYFAYDALGNPTKYKVASTTSANNMTWTQGRYLSSGTLNGNTFSYEYDASGMRYKKTVNGTTTEYYIVDGRIMAEKTLGFAGSTVYYFYDATGIAGMIHNGTYFFYIKNALGDVIEVVDANGNSMAWFDYDAWGNVLGEGGVLPQIVPFRYRGYYYDRETGFYYLQSRYYDPDTMRFINADDYEIYAVLMNDTAQLYMYNYCNNNPVMYTDPSGTFVLTLMIIGAAIGLLIGGGIAVAEQVAEHGWDTSQWDITYIIVAALCGALSGMLAATPIGVWGQIGINAALGMAQNTVKQLNSGEEFDVFELMINGLIGGFAGRFGGAGVLYVGKTLTAAIGNYVAQKTLKALTFNLIYGIAKATVVGVVGGYGLSMSEKGV